MVAEMLGRDEAPREPLGSGQKRTKELVDVSHEVKNKHAWTWRDACVDAGMWEH